MFLLQFLLLSFMVAAASAMGPPHGPPPHGKGGYNPYHDAPAHYQYGYKVNDDYHGVDFGHEEKREGKYMEGVYHVLLRDGRGQTVKYNVDGYGGYVADVSYSGKGYAPPPHKPHKPVKHTPPHANTKKKKG